MDASIRAVIDSLIERVPGVRGAIVGSADGHVLVTQTPGSVDDDAAAAMAAATIGLGHRVVGLVGEAPVSLCHQRSDDAQAFIFAIDHFAVLTVLSDATTGPEHVRLVGSEAVTSLRQIFTDAG